MNTNMITIDPQNIDSTLCGEAGRILANGGTVAFPTETVYGLGANALDPNAVAKIFAAKGRPSDNPLIVHIADISQADALTERVTPVAKAVMTHFFPGPISVILKKSTLIPDAVSAGLDTVALRMPAHNIARAIIAASGVPVAAPSANLSGKPSPTMAKHVIADLDGRVDMIIDGGNCDVGLESTVLDLSGGAPTILRPGRITPAMLEPIIGNVSLASELDPTDNTPKAPGMKYTHYAPDAKVTVIAGNTDLCDAYISDARKRCFDEGKHFGILEYRDIENTYNADSMILCGTAPDEYGANLFAALRRFDEDGIDEVVAPFHWQGEYAQSIANRLFKSAGGNVVVL